MTFKCLIQLVSFVELPPVSDVSEDNDCKAICIMSKSFPKSMKNSRIRFLSFIITANLNFGNPDRAQTNIA